jgi:hypothetical protein
MPVGGGGTPNFVNNANRALGRISGPLLADNLLRNGVDLAFETQLLYFDVKNKRIGVKYGSPTVDLFINNTTNTTNLRVPDTTTVGDFVISTNQIQHATGSITIVPNQSSNPTVTTPGLSTANLYLYGNTISDTVTNDSINFTAEAAGNINLNNNTTVTGNLRATGNITANGNIQFGDNLTQDTVSFGAEIDSDIIPSTDNAWNLGSSSLSLEWANLYVTNLKTGSLTSTNLTVNNINLTLAPGYTVYVSVNGNDANTGIHQHAPVRTVAYALSIATAGTEIVIFPGTYTEIFPLTVPAGVSVRGAGIRAVTIQPTSGTNTNNAFLMNGETTVEFLTVKDFYAPGNAFSFAPNFTVTTRSPYVQNVTVITVGPNAGNGALVDGSLATSASKEASMLFSSVTMIVPNATGIQATNGARVEWLNSFTYFAYRGIYLTQGMSPSGSLTFSSNNYLSLGTAQTIGTQAYTFECFFYTASNGLQTLLGASSSGGMSIWLFGNGTNPVTTIQIDRSYVDAAQYTVSPITLNTWHHIAVTRDSANNTSVFLDGVKAVGSASNATNYTGPSGLIGAVAGSAYFFTGYLTQIKLAVGSNYYNPTAASISVPTALLTTSANTKLLLTAATSGAYLTDTSGTQTVSNISGVTYSTSTPFLVKAGAEMRSIGSANVYGTYGAVADGADTLGYLIGHNFGYIGTGLDSQNDYGLVIQANEVVRENGGQLYYDSMDHRGDYRIGDIFYVNQQTGEISFNAQAINLLNNGSILLENGTSRTLVQAADIQVANIRIHGNSVDSMFGPINFLAFNSTTNLNTNVNVAGDLQVTGNTTIQGNITFGDAISDTVTIADYLTQTVKPKQNNLYSLGSASAVWRNIYTDLAQFGQVQFSGNQITTTTASTDLLIQSTTGNINVEYLKFNDNNITNIWPTPTTDTQKSVIFTPNGTGNVEINSTKSLILPIGNNSTRVLSSNGEIRYNSLYNNIEGYSNTGYVNFFNVYSQNQQTYITPELTPNAADSTLRFAIGNVVTTTISSSTLTTVNLVPGNVGISGSTVQNTQTNTDVEFVPNGTGKINLKSFVNVKDNTVTNATSTDISFNSTNQGHWKFGGKSGVVIPLGTNSDYPITPLQGAIRYNTVSGFAEVYTGSAWTSWVGTGNATVTEADMNDLTFLYTLILG